MTFTVGFVTGATPDKWARAWRERSREPLVLEPVEEAVQLDGVRRGEHDVALVRLPVDRDGLHLVRLYDEQPVVLAGVDHLVAAADEISLDDLADEQLVAPHPSGWTPTAPQLAWPAMTPREAVETVAAGTGVVLLPMSVARLLARKDVVQRPVVDLEPTTIGVAWLVEHDDERTQSFVAITRGRGARSSRS